MNKTQINAQIQQTQLRSVELMYRIEAAQKEHQAAVFVEDGITAQSCRDKLHALYDQQMDVSASVISLTRMLILAPD